MRSHNAPLLYLRLFFLAIVAAIVAGGGFLWWQDAILPVDLNDSTPQQFAIKSGEGVKSIVGRLVQQNLIRSPTGFFILVKLLGIEKQLEAGDYRLNRAMDATTIARELTHGMTDVWVTTLEGWRVEEIATKLTKELDIPESEFLKFTYEGYMFPDTYLIPRDATASAIVAMFSNTFDQKVTWQIRQDATKLGFPFYDVVTLASIVEREGRSEEDRPIIAGILLKRLKVGWPLQADATLQYALGYQSWERSWWKKGLTEEDKKIDSPYNTYLNPGLPPGPIANPGLASIKAVIYPAETDYWYYLHDLEGKVHYARTIEEHSANIIKYLQ